MRQEIRLSFAFRAVSSSYYCISCCCCCCCCCRFTELSIIAGDWAALDGDAVECLRSCSGCRSRRHPFSSAATAVATAAAAQRAAGGDDHVALQRLLRRAILERLGRAIGRLIDLSQEHFKEKLLFFLQVYYTHLVAALLAAAAVLLLQHSFCI